MVITTWNSQGDPTARENKLKILEDLLRQSDVVMIQECGNMAKLSENFPSINMICQKQTGAFNSRCSTCILAHDAISIRRDEYGYLPSSNGRWFIVANYKDYVLSTLHANAYLGGANDVISALRGQTTGLWEVI